MGRRGLTFLALGGAHESEKEVHVMRTHIWRGVVLTLVAVLVAAPIGLVGKAHAQTQPGGSQGAPGMGNAKQIEGTVKSVDPSGRVLMLEDGTQLMIPPAVGVQREALREGAIVKASFEERDGQKVVTSMEVRAP